MDKAGFLRFPECAISVLLAPEDTSRAVCVLMHARWWVPLLERYCTASNSAYMLNHRMCKRPESRLHRSDSWPANMSWSDVDKYHCVRD